MHVLFPLRPMLWNLLTNPYIRWLSGCLSYANMGRKRERITGAAQFVKYANGLLVPEGQVVNSVGQEVVVVQRARCAGSHTNSETCTHGPVRVRHRLMVGMREQQRVEGHKHTGRFFTKRGPTPNPSEHAAIVAIQFVALLCPRPRVGSHPYTRAVLSAGPCM